MWTEFRILTVTLTNVQVIFSFQIMGIIFVIIMGILLVKLELSQNIFTTVEENFEFLTVNALDQVLFDQFFTDNLHHG